jgi:serine/threonine protein kinase
MFLKRNLDDKFSTSVCMFPIRKEEKKCLLIYVSFPPQITLGLKTLHSKDIAHRDLKGEISRDNSMLLHSFFFFFALFFSLFFNIFLRAHSHTHFFFFFSGANIFLDNRFNAKLGDLGSSRKLHGKCE